MRGESRTGLPGAGQNNYAPTPTSSAATTTNAFVAVERPRAPPEPAHQGLVDLDLPGEPIPPWAHHGPAQLVQPRPGGLIAPQAQDLLQAQGAGPGLLIGHVPHRPEPRRQGGARAVEDGARRDRSLVTAARALPQHRAHGPGAGVPAAWTDKPRRPAQLREIGPTSFFGGESGLELRERSRVILTLGDPRCWGHLSQVDTQYPGISRIKILVVSGPPGGDTGGTPCLRSTTPV